ncbi:hypothetical protein BS756_00895 [Staphylococcus sp. MB371]|uniref:hypothetical protein n=1 Tax=Mammaliicoccus sciuri TaxID=1296 RepID=UPI0009929E0B|nr:hypothetical protein [Mammaliicoccus sciuri]OOV39574.1 hypothetical protein BS756_00895 [Staphylococcus sp. MB371]
MTKKLLVLLSILLAISIVVFMIAYSYYKQELSSAKSNESSYKVTIDNIKNAKNTEKSNRVLINKVDTDPNKLANEANEKALKVIDVLKQSSEKSDEEKQKIYQVKLENDITDEMMKNPDLASIVVPDKYDVQVATSRGHSIEVLLTSNTSRYLKLNYNTATNKIDHITEYSVQS